jgi:biotin carboxyl carrier protein
VLELYAQVLAARTPSAAANALVGSLARSLGLARASLALHQDGRTTLLASSAPEPVLAQAESTQRLLGAMDEALEQAQCLSWPPAVVAVQATAEPICIEHRALHRLTGGAVATVPLGQAGELFGALSVEREGALAFTAAELRQLEQLLTLAAPALRWMLRGDESSALRLRRDLQRAWQGLRQPDRRTARRLIVLGLLAVAFLAAAPLQREVGGRARIEGAEQRVLVAPADGFVKQAHVRPGDRVKAGDLLVDLQDGDLRLERERWASQLAQHENAYAAAMAKADRATASTSLARIAEAQSQLTLVDDQLARGRVVAPFDALVIQGDLKQSEGTPVRQGDTLLTLATSGRHRVIVEVDEVDIAQVTPGQSARLALSSLPWDSQGMIIERIMPLAKAVDGRNVFEVEARLTEARTDVRPGLLGRAAIVVGRLPPLWAWTGHALDRARVAWWTWMG